MEMKTFPRVVELLQSDLRRTKSVNAIVRKTRLTHNTVGNYLEGRAEPTQSSLKKIGAAYGKSIAWLRGDTDTNADIKPGAKVFYTAALSETKRNLWEVIETLEDEKLEGVLALLQSLLPKATK